MEKKKEKPTLATLNQFTEAEDQNLQQVVKEVEERLDNRKSQEAPPPHTSLPHGGWKD